MVHENRVNYLDGKNWLKNSVNYYEFDEFDIDAIQQRFYEFCYKERVSGKTLLNNDGQQKDNYDFTFRYIYSFEELKIQLSIIKSSAYNSYHVIMLNDAVCADGSLIAKYITDTITNNNLEYRGKIIINCKKENVIRVALMILNRVSESEKLAINYPNISRVKTSVIDNYIINSRSKMDKYGLKHPAPFSYIDIHKLCEKEGLTGQTILDPFLGVGSTILGGFSNNYVIGIELNPEYVELTKERIEYLNINGLSKSNYRIIQGDALKKVASLNDRIDATITSPPYFNILKNKNKGVRHDSSQSRQGVEYYSDEKNDIGNIENYQEYLDAMKKLYSMIYDKTSKKGRFYLVISDFTIDKKETDIHSDMMVLMDEIGYAYRGTSYLLQNQKAIYPFGYPYKIVLNHIFQYVMMFEKD